MDEELNAISQMRAVTVSREYGSGGGEIATRLATRLGWRLIDHEIVVQVAQELEVSETEAEAYDEHVEGIIARLLASMQLLQPPIPVTALPMPLADPQTYHTALRQVVEGAVAAGHVVIVGRGAQVLLTQRRDVLHVRIVAPLPQRVTYVMHRESLTEAAARARIQLKDRDRVRYLQTQHHQHSGDPHLYDLVINTGALALDNAVDLIEQALRYKANRLKTVTGELGPGAGVAPYTGQPGDIRPPENMTAPESS